MEEAHKGANFYCMRGSNFCSMGSEVYVKANKMKESDRTL